MNQFNSWKSKSFILFKYIIYTKLKTNQKIFYHIINYIYIYLIHFKFIKRNIENNIIWKNFYSDYIMVEYITNLLNYSLN